VKYNVNRPLRVQIYAICVDARDAYLCLPSGRRTSGQLADSLTVVWVLNTMDHQEVICEDVRWIEIIQNIIQLQAFVSMTINFGFNKSRELLQSCFIHTEYIPMACSCQFNQFCLRLSRFLLSPVKFLVHTL
jgi:hypothetical protein